ncbi:iron ABC transporter substrate-binding protein [Pimelobacter simplex]|uniref:Iron ABC transporter substrate-binding protein n=1 Tax=Nocardioides simplex TaxID=2045 RepID=A0A7J5DTE0_NOCSI|nr:iron ABC transporter substrate-binding protein [Pimelobacter simplex]KAB2808387.1 iron ABC transporter substrate-binding protein [Pimelobacter simplex]
MKNRLLRAGLGVAAATLVLPLLAACGGDDEPTLVIYNAQHEPLLKALAPEFTKETGIEVELRNGKDLELSNQIVQEGKASPADIFLTENSPGMSQVEAAGLLDKLPADLVAPIPEQYRPRSGLWTGFVARSTVLVYNTDQTDEAAMPASLLDLAKPEWKGKIAFSPTGADFQAIVAAVLDLEGEAATKAWLEGIKANGKVYDGNNLVLEAVNSGEIEVGIVYHYYWERDHKESGDVSDHSSQYYFANGDPGAFVSVSGAGILKSSDMKTEARKFIEFLVNEKGQQILADSYALEYPLNAAVQLEGVQKPFSELQPPAVNVSDLDAKKVVDLMTEVGFL